jgi:hypothetical protein
VRFAGARNADDRNDQCVLPGLGLDQLLEEILLRSFATLCLGFMPSAGERDRHLPERRRLMYSQQDSFALGRYIGDHEGVLPLGPAGFPVLVSHEQSHDA